MFGEKAAKANSFIYVMSKLSATFASVLKHKLIFMQNLNFKTTVSGLAAFKSGYCCVASSLAAQLHYTLTLVSDWFLPPSLSPIPAGRRVGIVLGWEREDAPSPIGKAEDRTQNPFKVLSRQQQRTKRVTVPFRATSVPIYWSKVSLWWPPTDRN